MGSRKHARLPALGLLLALTAGCAGDGAQREAGDAVSEADAALLAGLLERNHTEGGADFVVTAPYGREAVLTLTGEVDFRAGTGRAQAVTSTGGTEEMRTVFFTREDLWFGDVPGVETAGTGTVYLGRPIAVDGERPPLVDVLVTVLLGSAMIGLGDVGAQWSFGQAWVSASYALWLVAVALLLAVVVPAQKAAGEAIAEGRDGGAYAGRISAAGGVAALAFTAIIVLMVLKPGV